MFGLVFQQAWMVVAHAQLCQHLSDKGESKISVWDFLPIAWRCNCWQLSGPTGEKRAFLSTSMFDDWPCSYWPSYLYCQRTPCDGYNPPQLLALSHSRVCRNNCLLWVDREYLSGGVRHSCPSTLQLISHLWSLHDIATFQSQCLGPEVLGHVLAMWPNCPTIKFFFSGPSRHTGQGRKRSCPYTVYAEILLPPLSDLSLYYVLLSDVVPPFVCLYQGKHSCHMYIL